MEKQETSSQAVLGQAVGRWGGSESKARSSSPPPNPCSLFPAHLMFFKQRCPSRAWPRLGSTLGPRPVDCRLEEKERLSGSGTNVVWGGPRRQVWAQHPCAALVRGF